MKNKKQTKQKKEQTKKRKRNKKKRNMKPLLPSLKEKKRYVVFHIISNKKFNNPKKIFNAIKLSYLNLFGQFGMAKAGIIFLKERYYPEKQKGIIKIGNKYAHNLKTSFLFIKKIDNTSVIIRGIGVSGTIKKAVGKFI